MPFETPYLGWPNLWVDAHIAWVTPPDVLADLIGPRLEPASAGLADRPLAPAALPEEA